MSSDDLPSKTALHGPLCEIFWGTIPANVKRAVNAWIREHPNVFIEQQDVTASQDALIIVIWYTEDSADMPVGGIGYE